MLQGGADYINVAWKDYELHEDPADVFTPGLVLHAEVIRLEINR